ncbi:Centromere protein V [Zea mays]|uniref:Centromere protein V n=1 Tax=Zea mays TaxID=4577 RepID=A0A3L6FPV4_MAIZE|nr:Centromere protein V [Zea mays]
MASEAVVVHTGGCHCRRLRWQVEAPASVVAWICNCSDCSMRANTHFIVPAAKFKLQAGADEFITTYTFGTHTAKHTFCKTCGITSFYTPRSNPDGVAITVACVDPGIHYLLCMQMFSVDLVLFRHQYIISVLKVESNYVLFLELGHSSFLQCISLPRVNDDMTSFY